MFPEIRRDNAAAEFLLYPGRDQGTYSLQFLSQKIGDAGQQRPSLAGKQIQHGPGAVRQGKLSLVPLVGIVRGKLPAAFLAQDKDAVDNVIHKASLVFHTLRCHQGTQGMSPGKIQIFVSHPVAGALKIHKIRGKNRRVSVAQIGFSLLQNTLSQIRGNLFIPLWM